ncbi:hypothetical protein P8452_21451 [Trifolium repens]|nr:hypothetical protein P8452_21451 [Trifolium repens]
MLEKFILTIFYNIFLKTPIHRRNRTDPFPNPNPNPIHHSPPHSLHDSRFLRFRTVPTSILLQASSSMEMMVEGFCWV